MPKRSPPTSTPDVGYSPARFIWLYAADVDSWTGGVRHPLPSETLAEAAASDPREHKLQFTCIGENRPNNG
jgi:hypothetical protein